MHHAKKVCRGTEVNYTQSGIRRRSVVSFTLRLIYSFCIPIEQEAVLVPELVWKWW
jgi:hypothetical protein